MKTQISRDGYRRDKRYSGVYQQQGRLITDSDWNELVDTVKARVDDALVDVVGTGSPKGRAATIQMVVTTPKIVPGTVYAGGLEAQVADPPGVIGPFDYSLQADFPSAPPLPALNTAYRFYVDAWDRPVGALEDDGLRDPALHGADTCTRTQTMAQVKWCPVTKNPESPADNPGQGDARLTIKYPSGGSQPTADACDPKAQEVDPVGGDFLFRVEIHDVRWSAGAVPSVPDRVVVKWSRENGAEQYAFTDMPDWFKTGPWLYELYDVDSERHLGFHLATTNWTPKRGSLTTTLPQNAPAGTMVRRWEGYLVLVRSGGVAWDVSTANGEKLADTAPGATVQWGDGTMTVSLADLEFSMQVPNRVFLPGDFWAAPVRRATYQAGKELLKNALPSGIVHRYVTLAEVQTNNTLKARTAQEQRKLAFPRLSELDAGDMGYSTTCSSGLFDSTHDTVKKALDRLCSINGSHVGYTKPSDTSVFKGNNPTTVKTALDLLAGVTSDDIGYTTTCTSGLFDGTHDTVEKALNRLCAINGTHVGFTPSANTSIYAGANPTTVTQALNLLTDVKSQQISYTPGSNPAVHDVKAALDELYARPVQNGTRVYVGTGGQYASLDLALTDLLGQGKKDIALALMPGSNKLGAAWNPGNLTGVRLNILGLGAATQLITKGVTFDRAEAVQIEHLHWVAEDNNTIHFSRCGEVLLKDNVIEGDVLVNKTLIHMTEVRRVVIQDNVIDSQWETLDPLVVNMLGFDAFENIPDFFSVALSEFRGRARTLATTLMNLPVATRNNLASGIITRLNQNSNNLTPDEFGAYFPIATNIQLPNDPLTVDELTRVLEQLRHVLYVKNPGTSIVFSTFTGPTIVQGNQISGLIGLASLPKAATNLFSNPGGFLTNTQSGKINYPTARNVLQVTGNVMAGIRGGESLVNALLSVASGSFFSYSGSFRILAVTDNVIENDDNLFIAEEVNLQGNNFTTTTTPIFILQIVVAWVTASSSVLLNNRARNTSQGSRLYCGVTPGAGTLLANNNFRLFIATS
jgi:Family of unknown function (DUF6519)